MATNKATAIYNALKKERKYEPKMDFFTMNGEITTDIYADGVIVIPTKEDIAAAFVMLKHDGLHVCVKNQWRKNRRYIVSDKVGLSKVNSEWLF